MKRLLFSLLVVVMAASSCGDDAGNVFSLTKGICFDDQDSAEVRDVPIVDCSEPHDNEVFHLFDLADGEYPGEEAIGEAARDGCLGAFDDYVGLDFASSSLSLLFLVPLEDGWENADDREVVCFLYDDEGAKLTGSMQESGI